MRSILTPMTRTSLLRLALGLLLTTTLTSCGSTFGTAWKKAPDTNSVEGRWEGTWQSSTSGNRGQLRCAVDKPLPGSHDILDYVSADGRVSSPRPRCFYYHATWNGAASGSYTAFHDVQRLKDGSIVFKGEYLRPKWAGGLNHYEGTIKGDEFTACYQSATDRGTYSMKRVR
ncbi:MAG: hypothetical protein NTY98_15930 [Verrucomicrobia bacterium]|nr:hypothetical protein [Verrucomicrobiota bacterium]